MLEFGWIMVRVALPFGGKTPEKKRAPYRKALAAVGVQPVENAVTLDGLAGLLLAGGTDVDPALFGAPRDARTVPPDCARDSLEIALLREALERDMPVLAICRGLQLLNVALGGTLTQHIEGHRCPERQEVHRVAIAADSKLRAILKADELMVNSRHHQCVGAVAGGLVVMARAPLDGVVEGLEFPGKRFVVAVQWHPEDRTDGLDGRLFAAFGDAARDFEGAGT